MTGSPNLCPCRIMAFATASCPAVRAGEGTGGKRPRGADQSTRRSSRFCFRLIFRIGNHDDPMKHCSGIKLALVHGEG